MRNAIAIILFVAFAAPNVHAQSQVAAEPMVGLRDNRPDDYALVGAKVVIEPGRSIEDATILIRDTSIVAVGSDIEIPAGYNKVDLQGRIIYPGLIDAFSEEDVPFDESDREAVYWNKHIVPGRAASTVAAKPSGADKLRSQGITVRLVAPKGAIVKGTSAAVLLNDESRGRTVLKTDVWQHAQLTVPRDRRGESYPNSPMGAVALLRQSLYDARWYTEAWETYRSTPALSRPETNTTLAALSDAMRSSTFVFDAQNDRMVLRAEQIAKEFSIPIIVRGSGQEYQQLDEIAAMHRPILVPVDFPDAPDVKTAAGAQDVTLKELMHWHLAPQNPAELAGAGVTICLTTDGLDDAGKFLEKIRVAVERGLSSDEALAAVTTTPATLLQIDQDVGAIRPGMLANLVVATGDLFQKETELLETWVAGKRFEIKESKEALLDSVVGTWELGFQLDAEPVAVQMKVKRKDQKLSAELALQDDASEGDDESESDEAQDGTSEHRDSKDGETENADSDSVSLKQLVRHRDRFTATVDLGKLDPSLPGGTSNLSFVTIDEPDGSLTVIGNLVFPNGSRSEIRVRPVDQQRVDQEHADQETTQEDAVEPDEQGDENRGDSTTDETSEEPGVDEETASEQGAERVAENDDAHVEPIEVMFPLGAYGLTEPVPSPPSVMFRGATVWTCDEDGVLDVADVLVRDGQIVEVGRRLDVPNDCQVVDARGKHLTPGLIDCHSHMATDGGVNESGQTVTAEVRIGDFVDNSDISIYRQLAGGLTIANILHGSANPIGGQNQVIKLRWGQSMDGLRMKEAPPGIKFALGENVKRTRSRYPNSRMGVEQIIRDQLLASREYESSWRRWRSGERDTLPPRVDLQLEAMSEVGRRRRWIHCHSYRQDEIVATLDVLEEFGVRIGTLQHILEGYKVADRMARHGAMGSSFSDWWAYKFEVYDAIPYNGAVMHEQGVVVSFNSDDAELARRLNTEAAKATKYGGVSEEEALKFVTLNPAKQLRIDSYVGSITPGKHADLVLWSGPPLSTTSRCEQTWVDGRQYFGLDQDAAMRDRDARLHAQLVQLAIGKDTKSSNARKEVKEEDRWLRYDEYCGASGANTRLADQEVSR